MLPEIYVLRHGETEWNRAGRWQGHLDSPLTEKGRGQAQAMGRLLSHLGVSPDSHKVFCSPQERARQTADLAFGAGMAIADDRLREIGVGDFAGLHRDEIFEQVRLPEDADFIDYYAAAPGGEPFEALYARVSDLLAGLDHPAVFVTHGITSRFLRTAAMGWGLDRIMDLPGGQGVVHRIFEGRHETLDATGLSS